jgi:uncharacterized protein (TIGR03084 family)
VSDVSTSLSGLCADLAAETDVLLGWLRPLAPAQWDQATPAEGWSIRDTVSHLAYFDDRAVQAATDPAAFESGKAALLASADPDADSLGRGRAMEPSDVLAWFSGERSRLLEVFGPMSPKDRIPWYGPAMSAASCVTARLMETWAHGQDVADAFGESPSTSDRLRHVAHIGVRARAFAYAIRRMTLPSEEVQVILTGPNGDEWRWNEPTDGTAAANVLRGPALDFCLVVTQRRHRDDTRLVAHGPLAQEWLSIAQSFAGPPGEGRAAGAFPHTSLSE